MFKQADVVRTTMLEDFAAGQAFIDTGICEAVTRIVDVKPGTLPHMAHMHPTRVFHKGADRKQEHAAMRIIELIAPDIAVPMTPDQKRGKNQGVYMRFIRGRVVQYRRTYHAQHKYDFGAIAVIDALIGNTDRHSGNAVVTKAHVHPIDHGTCFAYGMLSRSFCFMDDWTRTSIRIRRSSTGSSVIQNDSCYRGVCDTLERVQRYAVDISGIADTVKYMGSPNDIREWATDMMKMAERDHRRKASRW